MRLRRPRRWTWTLAVVAVRLQQHLENWLQMYIKRTDTFRAHGSQNEATCSCHYCVVVCHGSVSVRGGARRRSKGRSWSAPMWLSLTT